MTLRQMKGLKNFRILNKRKVPIPIGIRDQLRKIGKLNFASIALRKTPPVRKH